MRRLPFRSATTLSLAVASSLSFTLTACAKESNQVTWVTSTKTVIEGQDAAATSGSTASPGNGEPNSVNSAEGTQASGSATPAEAGVVQAKLQALIDSTVAAHGGSAAVAIADASGAVTTAGTDTAMPTWSTIKVPLSIAALRHDPAVKPQVTQAITVSDNAAAEQLWSSLGTPEQAAKATGDVLSEAGLSITVNAVKTRPEFTAFGQTQMTTAQEATFAAALPGIKGADEVLQLMGTVDPSQSYGLGQIEGAKFKGGWGPNTSGAYDVRQLGVVPAGSGTKGVAITLSPASGTYEEAQTMATEIANGLSEVL